jgi:hypothetical protein
MSFDRLRTNGKRMISFVVSLSNRERNETRRQRRFAASGLGGEDHRARADLHRAGVKHPLALLAQHQRQHLVQIEVLDRGFRNLGRGAAGDVERVRRDLEIGQIGKARQIAAVHAVELASAAAWSRASQALSSGQSSRCSKRSSRTGGWAIRSSCWKSPYEPFNPANNPR